ncbi:MAG: serine/threonine-protein kinase [Gemmataceae bacterium]|nr:serine/threonine-protein kinase [Gemmataceae bacterium]
MSASDADRTVDYLAAQSPQPKTIDVSQPEQSTRTIGSYVPPPLEGAPSIAGYRTTAEIARGGMGRIYAAIDETLDREVVIKTLLPGADAERFVTEAKITAKLPHPNIPPVHALGTLEDGTPWLAMKRIHGRTLAQLLASRRSPLHPSCASGGGGTSDLSHYIQIFEQIAQAVGFAHSRGIIHRDLKPLNVMVGEFGEVQVMDWGLAKELHGEVVDKLSPPTLFPEGEGQRDEGDETGDQRTRPGTIMGTPGYMAPEQARGEVVDQRADVFALGSILATILTGQPAFVGKSTLEMIQKAANAELSEVFSRLDACGADADLIALCKRCLSAHREGRPANGQIVANEIAAYRVGVEARLRQAEADRARAETQAAEQAKRRRVWIGLAVSLLVGFVVSLVLAIWAVRAERIATAERDAEEAALQAETQARQEAETRRVEAEQNLAYAKKGNELLGSVFSGLDPKANYATVAEFRDVLKRNLHKAVE